jgi:hypothetical protein
MMAALDCEVANDVHNEADGVDNGGCVGKIGWEKVMSVRGP